MTLDQFDKTLGYLLKVVLPPNAGSDDRLSPSDVLDVLLKYADEVRGAIIRQGFDKAETRDIDGA
jgi:hypothetical protein